MALMCFRKSSSASRAATSSALTAPHLPLRLIEHDHVHERTVKTLVPFGKRAFLRDVCDFGTRWRVQIWRFPLELTTFAHCAPPSSDSGGGAMRLKRLKRF